MIIGGTITVEHVIISYKTDIKTSKQYIPVSIQKDSLLMVQVVLVKDLVIKLDLKLDTNAKRIHNLSTIVIESNKNNIVKFNSLIKDNINLKQSFNIIDNSLKCIEDGLSTYNEKKNFSIELMQDLTNN